jgi:hypothetical protein
MPFPVPSGQILVDMPVVRKKDAPGAFWGIRLTPQPYDPFIDALLRALKGVRLKRNGLSTGHSQK